MSLASAYLPKNADAKEARQSLKRLLLWTKRSSRSRNARPSLAIIAKDLIAFVLIKLVVTAQAAYPLRGLATTGSFYVFLVMRPHSAERINEKNVSIRRESNGLPARGSSREGIARAAEIRAWENPSNPRASSAGVVCSRRLLASSARVLEKVSRSWRSHTRGFLRQHGI